MTAEETALNKITSLFLETFGYLPPLKFVEALYGLLKQMGEEIDASCRSESLEE